MNDGTTGYGGVANTYRISKTEVTNAQYADFLNAVDKNGNNSLGLFNTSMTGTSAVLSCKQPTPPGASLLPKQAASKTRSLTSLGTIRSGLSTG